MIFTVDPTDANPQDMGNGIIDITVTHPTLGKIRYSASEHDPSFSDSEELYQRTLNGEFGHVAPFMRNIEREWDSVREHRDHLLLRSDWTQLPDANVINRQAWSDYRQSLRDITNTFADPDEIVWPNPEDFLDSSPNWRGFLQSLRTTTVFNTLRGQSRQNVNVNALATELRAELSEAVSGISTEGNIQPLLDELSVVITTSQKQEISDLIVVHHIPLTIDVGVGTA